MTDLTTLTANERRRIVDDYFRETSHYVRAMAKRMPSASFRIGSQDSSTVRNLPRFRVGDRFLLLIPS